MIPPYVLVSLVVRGTPAQAERARRTLAADQVHRTHRVGQPEAIGGWSGAKLAPLAQAEGQHAPHRMVADSDGAYELPGRTVRAEGQAPTTDAAANEAYDGLGMTWEFFWEVFARDSLDGKGLPLLASVHYGRDYDNAFWDGAQMVFGDGDGELFNRFTLSLDVIGHELAHGVTEYTAGLVYRGQAGALNESISDVFGSLARQYALGHDVVAADWLIGAELFTAAVHGVALRSMKEPGSAYDDPVLGKDPQPGSMEQYVVTDEDNGGVHINSGIPNRAFYLAATAIGANAWEGAGLVWYDVLVGKGIAADCDFATFAHLTVEAAAVRYGEGSVQTAAVQDAWQQVGVLPMPGADPGSAESDTVESGGDAGVDPWPSGEFPATDLEVLVRRTGGFAGLAQQRSVRLGQLPAERAQEWSTLLAGTQLDVLAAKSHPGLPDAFRYQVACPVVGVDVSFPEHLAPPSVHELLRWTLQQPE